MPKLRTAAPMAAVANPVTRTLPPSLFVAEWHNDRPELWIARCSVQEQEVNLVVRSTHLHSRRGRRVVALRIPGTRVGMNRQRPVPRRYTGRALGVLVVTLSRQAATHAKWDGGEIGKAQTTGPDREV